MEFKYQAIDQQGKQQSGVVSSAAESGAIDLLQKRGLTITSLVNTQNSGIENLMKGTSHARIGIVAEGSNLKINGASGTIVDETIENLETAFKKTITW